MVPSRLYRFWRWLGAADEPPSFWRVPLRASLAPMIGVLGGVLIISAASSVWIGILGGALLAFGLFAWSASAVWRFPWRPSRRRARSE
jgi:hypothetical protein